MRTPIQCLKKKKVSSTFLRGHVNRPTVMCKTPTTWFCYIPEKGRIKGISELEKVAYSNIQDNPLHFPDTLAPMKVSVTSKVTCAGVGMAW